ncbi:MAG: hypothetical protein HY658_06410, partial [Actinobacteria bacterium]|nr:hypothetical protein [Actinomycetota bacterium]
MTGVVRSLGRSTRLLAVVAGLAAAFLVLLAEAAFAQCPCGGGHDKAAAAGAGVAVATTVAAATRRPDRDNCTDALVALDRHLDNAILTAQRAAQSRNSLLLQVLETLPPGADPAKDKGVEALDTQLSALKGEAEALYAQRRATFARCKSVLPAGFWDRPPPVFEIDSIGGVVSVVRSAPPTTPPPPPPPLPPTSSSSTGTGT